MAPSLTLALDSSDHHTVAVDGEPWLDVSSAVSPDIGGEVELRAVATGPDTALLVLAGRDLHGIAGTGFADPQIAWSIRPRVDELTAMGVRTFGYQYMEFALPCSAGPDGRGLAPWPIRPPAAMPIMWGGPGRPTLLLGPLDHPHESVIVVPSDEAPRDDLRCGWHGDLDHVADLETEFVLLVAGGPRAAIARYGELVRTRAGTQRGTFAQDPAVRGLSYWTDNGAEYYYRPAADRTYPETIGAAVDALEQQGLAIHAVQLDSWWYPHETLRGIGEGATVVPPSGAMTWDPREDALPGGFAAVRDAVGRRPLVLHSRHLAESSPYFAEGGFAVFVSDASGADGMGMDGTTSGHAHPASDDLLDAWMEQAASWGACTYEQDWLVEIFLTVAGLRRRPGQADAWMWGMDRSAARRGLTLQLCMGTPATFLATAAMTQVSSIRTSMDFRYIAERQGNWGWFLHVNALARAMGLATSKDVFVTTGDEFAVVEAFLAAMSCGPVGIGDPIGATDAALVGRTCREDGILVQPDVAIAAWSRSFFGQPMGSKAPFVGESYSDHPAGRWHYVAALAAAPAARQVVAVGLDALDLDRQEARAAADGRADFVARRDRTGELVHLRHGGRDHLDLEPGDDALDMWLIAPTLLGGHLAVFGDTSKFASVGDRRIGRITESDGSVSLLVLGVPRRRVALDGWAAHEIAVGRFLPGESGDLRVDRDAATGAWGVEVEVGPHGWTRVAISMIDP